jgi:hypothetical protein
MNRRRALLALIVVAYAGVAYWHITGGPHRNTHLSQQDAEA